MTAQLRTFAQKNGITSALFVAISALWLQTVQMINAHDEQCSTDRATFVQTMNEIAKRDADTLHGLALAINELSFKIDGGKNITYGR